MVIAKICLFVAIFLIGCIPALIGHYMNAAGWAMNLMSWTFGYFILGPVALHLYKKIDEKYDKNDSQGN